MDAREDALIRSLLDTEPELRLHYEEHTQLKHRLQELRQKSFLNEEEEREEKNESVRITRRQLRRIIWEAFDYPAGYEPTNVDKVYEIIQPLLDASNVGLDRQGQIAMEIAELYDAAVDNPDEIYGHAEEILKKDEGYYDEDEEEEQRYAAGRPWAHN